MEDNRQRRFVIQDKREEAEEPKATRPTRKSLREREAEAEAESRKQRARIRRGVRQTEETQNMPDEWEEEIEEEPRRKAPKIMRICAWAALFVILFAGGYIGTNYVFKLIDARGGKRVGGVYATGSEVKKEAEAPQKTSKTLKIYVPKNGTQETRTIETQEEGTDEESIMQVMTVLTDNLKEIGMLESDTSVKSVFINGDLLYLDMSQHFRSSLKKLDTAKCEQMLAAYLKTARENFSPVKKVKFYANSKAISDNKSVNMSEPWERTE